MSRKPRVMARLRLYKVINFISCNLIRNFENTISNLYRPTNVFCSVRRYSSGFDMKVLNVAEKHDAAKNIAGYLSRGTSKKVNNLSYTFVL